MPAGFGQSIPSSPAKQRKKRNNPESIDLIALRKSLDAYIVDQKIERINSILAKEAVDLPTRSGLIDLKAEFLIQAQRYPETIAIINKSLPLDPGNPDLLIKLASAYRNTGEAAKALPILKGLSERYPGQASIIYNYANAARDHGDSDKALELYSQAEAMGFTASDLYLNYLSLLSKKSYNKASKGLIRRVWLQQKDSEAFCFVACQVLMKLQLFEEATPILAHLKSSIPASASLFFLESQLREGLGDIEGALDVLQDAIHLEADNVDYLFHYGNILQVSGKIDEACNIYKEIIRLSPDSMEAHRRISVCTKYHQDHPHLTELRLLKSKTSSMNTENAKSFFFALAKAEEETKNYQEAIECYDQANFLMRQLISRDFDLHDWMKTAYTYLELDRHLLTSELIVKDQQKGQGLIFIVGMPRCGSTLTENILSSSPESLDLGESVAFSETIQYFHDELNDFEAISGTLLECIGDYYFNKISSDCQNAMIITDKNLYNWRYAGLIARCLPGAKIIHSLRNPVDNMLSIYKAHFPVGNEYAFDTDEIFKTYQLHFQTMHYYKQRYPKSIIESNYDQLVRNPTDYIPSLIQQLGLEWNNAFLTPENNQRIVRTASNIQVRSPIHARSVSGWLRFKPRFEAYAKRFKELGYEF